MLIKLFNLVKLFIGMGSETTLKFLLYFNGKLKNTDRFLEGEGIQMRFVVFFLSIATFIPLDSLETHVAEESKMVEHPEYLYKILSDDNWQGSQGKQAVVLSADDDAFIHFSTEDQLERIKEKYWGDVPQFVVLKIETAKLTGELVYEANPGGVSKYYHLYRGSIPLGAIAEILPQKSSKSCPSL